MKKIVLALSAIFMTLGVYSQIKTPQPSPAASIQQTVGLTEVKIAYSRPAMRGREVFGNLVPFDKIWRTGANSNTKIHFSDDILIQGSPLSAGEYALYSKPGIDTWELYFYTDTNNSGLPAAWDEAKIAAQATVPVQKAVRKVESFTISIDELTNNDANLTLAWDDTSVSLKIEVPTREKAISSIKSVMAGFSVNASDYYAAASYYQDENLDLNKAKEWIDKAASMNPDPYWILRRKALIYEAIGDKKGAISAAKLSLEAARKAGNMDYVKLNQDSLKAWGAE